MSNPPLSTRLESYGPYLSLKELIAEVSELERIIISLKLECDELRRKYNSEHDELQQYKNSEESYFYVGDETPEFAVRSTKRAIEWVQRVCQDNRDLRKKLDEVRNEFGEERAEVNEILVRIDEVKKRIKDDINAKDVFFKGTFDDLWFRGYKAACETILEDLEAQTSTSRLVVDWSKPVEVDVDGKWRKAIPAGIAGIDHVEGCVYLAWVDDQGNPRTGYYHNQDGDVRNTP